MLIQKLIYINNSMLVLQYQIVENLVMSFSYETLQKKPWWQARLCADLVSFLLLPMVNNAWSSPVKPAAYCKEKGKTNSATSKMANKDFFSLKSNLMLKR